MPHSSPGGLSGTGERHSPGKPSDPTSGVDPAEWGLRAGRTKELSVGSSVDPYFCYRGTKFNDHADPVKIIRHQDVYFHMVPQQSVNIFSK